MFFQTVNISFGINPTIVYEDIDEVHIEHEFTVAQEAKEFARKLIAVKPIAKHYKVQIRSKTNSKPITMYDGPGNKLAESTANNLLSCS